MRCVLALLLLTAASPTPTPNPTPPPRDTLARDSETLWVPFELTPGNQIRFSLQVDGRPVTAILDTGVSYSVLSRSFVDAAGMNVRAGGSANAIGGIVPIGWIDTQSIVIGGLTRNGGSVTVARLPATATGSVAPIEMLVGRDLTADYALDIDYDAKHFRLLRSGRMPFRGAVAPLAIARDRLVYTGELLLNGRRVRPMIVDTGDGNGITVSSQAWAATGLIPAARTSTISFGLGGPIITDLVIVPELATGTLRASFVDVQIEPPGGFSHAMDMAGRIGSGFLQRYRVLLDAKAGRMVLAPGALAALPVLRSTSGLLVAVQSDRLRVLHVMRNSPAERDGWKPEETICMVDETPIPGNYAGSDLARWSIGTPGRVVALELCDGVKRRLTLRNFY